MGNIKTSREPDKQGDTVTIVMPVYNESRFIRKTLLSLISQEKQDFELEVLVIDGMSTDGTREIIMEVISNNPSIHLIDNPARKTPAAMNIGINHANGEYVAILGAHSLYRKDYISTCLKELKLHNVDGCSGRVICTPPEETISAKIACWVLEHKFGSSGNSFRTLKEGPVETLSYPLFVKSALLKIGGYNENLNRNQDNDLTKRLSAAGYKFYLTWKTTCDYYTQPNITALLKYGFRNGNWNAMTFLSNKNTMSLRHFIPAIFTTSLTVLFIGGVIGSVYFSNMSFALAMLPFTTVLIMHFTAGILSSISITFKKRDLAALLSPVVFFAFHFWYGVGTVIGLMPSTTGQDSEVSGTKTEKDL